MHAIEYLRAYRANVRDHGITGGNPSVRDGAAVCPRGFMASLDGTPNNLNPAEESQRRIALTALDEAAPPDAYGHGPIGSKAESHSRALEGDRPAAVAFVDRAIASLEMAAHEAPEPPATGKIVVIKDKQDDLVWAHVSGDIRVFEMPVDEIGDLGLVLEEYNLRGEQVKEVGRFAVC